MATVYRRRHRKPNGKTVQARKYPVKFLDAKAEAWRDVPGFTDERASVELGRKLERIAALRAAGEQPDPTLARWLETLPGKLRDRLAAWDILDSRTVATAKPLSQHLADYKQALLDGAASPRQKGPATEKHARTAKMRVQEIFDGIGARYLSDVKPEAVGRYLAERRAKEPGRRSKGLSVQTANHYLQNAKGFFNWLVRAKRAAENPLMTLGKAQMTPKARRLVRRTPGTGQR